MKIPPVVAQAKQPLTFSSVDMSTLFDTTFLPGGDLFASQDEFLDFGTNFQPTGYTAATDAALTPNDGTVSPTDLFRDDSIIMSAPPSTAFPNLSTPESGYLESPAMASSGLNTSPLEDGLLDGQLNFAELDSMAPLFPQDGCDQFAQQPVQTEPMPPKSSFSSVNSQSASKTASPMVRQKSSPGRPPSIPFTHGRKHSETHGISKSSKPRKSLPEITIDSEDDKETAKRKKNTAAARKSRQRKQEAAEAAEAEIQRLRAIIYRLGADPDAGI
ncbi:General control protein [Exophiala dermatitidis]|nr:General control protein [Exophiala dermatitidis]